MKRRLVRERALAGNALEAHARALQRHPRVDVRGKLPVEREHGVTRSERERPRRQIDAVRRVHHQRDLTGRRADELRAQLARPADGSELRLVGKPKRLGPERGERRLCLHGAHGERAGRRVVQVDRVPPRRPRELALAESLKVIGRLPTHAAPRLHREQVLRIERVAQCVAQEVEAEHGGADGQTGE